MTSLRALEQPLQAWRTFRDVARATRSLAAVQSQRWARHLEQVDAHLAWCARLRREYAPASAPAPTLRVLLALGTDHGLCGPLDRMVLDEASRGLAFGEAGPDLCLVFGTRLAATWSRLGPVVFAAPSSFPAVESLAAQVEGLLAARAEASRTMLRIVQAVDVDPDGTPVVEVVAPEHVGGNTAALPTSIETPHAVDLTPAAVTWPQVASLHLHAMVVAALCRAGAMESETRWRTMNRAHDAAERRIAEQERRVRRLRQELVTQQMLEARLGRGKKPSQSP